MAADWLARIREEKEVELQEMLRHSFEAQKTNELRRTKKTPPSGCRLKWLE
jgi:hypothetical protein